LHPLDPEREIAVRTADGRWVRDVSYAFFPEVLESLPVVEVYQGIKGELLFDIDAHDADTVYSAYASALEEARRLLEVLERELGIRPSAAVLTGRGAHVLTNMELDREARKALAEYLLSSRCRPPVKIDAKALVDVKRLRRWPGSPNVKTGAVAALIEPERLFSMTAEEAVEATFPMRRVYVAAAVSKAVKTPLGEMLEPGRRRVDVHTALWLACS